MIYIGKLTEAFITSIAVYSNKTIICSGDIQLWSESELIAFNKLLQKHNIKFYCCRGRVDNALFFRGNYNFSHLNLVQDYTIVDGHYFIGGGVAADRSVKTRSFGFNYPTEDAKALLRYIRPKVIVSHFPPDLMNIPLERDQLFWSKVDLTLTADIKSVRHELSSIFFDLLNKSVEKWVFSYDEPYKSTVILNNTPLTLIGVEQCRQLSLQLS
jgi:hypothetical protein